MFGRVSLSLVWLRSYHRLSHFFQMHVHHLGGYVLKYATYKSRVLLQSDARYRHQARQCRCDDEGHAIEYGVTTG